MPRASVYTISNGGHMDPAEAGRAEAQGQIVAYPPILQPDVPVPPPGEGIVPPAGTREAPPAPERSDEPPAARGSRMSRSYGHDPMEFEPAPNKSASKSDWVDYAVSKGLDRSEAEDMTKADLIEALGEGEEPSAGTSSSTSESKQDSNGGSHQDTESSRQSPAQTTGNRSPQGHPAGQQSSSSATTASGSTPRTGSSQPSQPTSSRKQPDTRTERSQGRSTDREG